MMDIWTKTTQRYHNTLCRVTKFLIILRVSSIEQQIEFLYTAGMNIKWYSLFGKLLAIT